MVDLKQKNSVIFGLRGGNKDFLLAQRTLLQSIIDQLEEIHGLTYQHEPFNCNLYWTDLLDSNSTVANTTVVDFTTQMKALLIEARSDVEDLLVKVRENQYKHETNYDEIYKAITIIMDQALKQWGNYIKLILIPYTDHTASDLDLYALDSNVFDTEMTASDSVQDAIDNSTLVDHSRFYYDSNTEETVYRKTHIGNMNMQSLRTFKRVIESLRGVWPRASVTLAKMNGKYAGHDMIGSADAPVEEIASQFSQFLNYIGSLTAVASNVATQLDEYIAAARPSSDDGVISYSTDDFKNSVTGMSKYFDGDESTVDAHQLHLI